MIISAIAAMSENRVIGSENTLPWHLPADLKHFKQVTMGHPILMGRKTFESIGRPLPGRQNIILTRDQTFHAQGCVIVHSVKDVMLKISEHNELLDESDELFVIGGAQIYQQMLPMTQRLYLTMIHHEFSGDVFFPEINRDEWREVECVRHEKDENNAYAFSFVVLNRVKGGM